MKPQADNEHRYSEEAYALLPAPVSGIQVQKKNKSRFSIFVDDEFLTGVSDSVLTKFNIYKGVEITPALLHQIMEAENKWAAREYMFRILSRRDHSRKELKTKAQKKGFSGDYVEEILDELEQKEYLNDAKFALKYASDKFEFNDWGPIKIRGKLIQKGISAQDIENALQIIPSESKKEKIINLVMKRKSHFLRKDIQTRKNKIYDYLLRKGFNYTHINNSLPEIEKIISVK